MATKKTVKKTAKKTAKKAATKKVVVKLRRGGGRPKSDPFATTPNRFADLEAMLRERADAAMKTADMQVGVTARLAKAVEDLVEVLKTGRDSLNTAMEAMEELGWLRFEPDLREPAPAAPTAPAAPVAEGVAPGAPAANVEEV
jgi:hypothetical protein